jgi:hypothetical protein
MRQAGTIERAEEFEWTNQNFEEHLDPREPEQGKHLEAEMIRRAEGVEKNQRVKQSGAPAEVNSSSWTYQDVE